MTTEKPTAEVPSPSPEPKQGSDAPQPAAERPAPPQPADTQAKQESADTQAKQEPAIDVNALRQEAADYKLMLSQLHPDFDFEKQRGRITRDGSWEPPASMRTAAQAATKPIKPARNPASIESNPSDLGRLFMNNAAHMGLMRKDTKLQ